MKVFEPQGAPYSVSATSTSANTAITTTAQVLRISNEGPNKVFVKWGSGAQTATTATTGYDVAVQPYSVECFWKGTADNVALICSATETATVRMNVGTGE